MSNKTSDKNISSEKIDLATAQKSVLSLVFFPNYISWLVEDIATKEVLDSGFEILKTIPLTPDKVSRLETLIPFLNLPFFKTVYTVSNDTYVLIPQYLFDADNKEKYLSFNSGLSNLSLSFIDTQVISEQESTLVYNLSKQLHSFIENKSPGSKVFHEKAVLLNAAPNVLGKEGMLLNFVEDHFDLLLRINNKTCFFNSFKINSTDDLLYFIYYIAEQYEFDPLSINFVHTGKIPELVSQKLVLKFFPNPNWNFTQQHNYNFIASKALLCE